MLWGIVAAIVAFIIICLTMPIKSKTIIQVRGGFTNIEVRPYIFFMNLGLKFRFKIVYTFGEGLYIARVTKTNLPKVIYLAKQFTKESFREPFIKTAQETSKLFSIEEMSVFIKLGAENAITTVYLCAIVPTVFDSMFSLQKQTSKNRNANFNLYVTPAFEPLIILNLEGIFRAYPTKIIRRIVRRAIKKLTHMQERKKKQCIQSKTL